MYNMNKDLKIIKKKYGEKMMHLCRDLFSTILDNSPGVLFKILLETFAPSHYLYDDLVDNERYVAEFKEYIYTIYDKLKCNKDKKDISIEDPVTLMKRAGYTLYECLTVQDIMSFKKYYLRKEELCTFNGNRLDRCFVYFAVKDNVEDIKRENFLNPSRQDEYGTSVISIQFTRDDSHTLSIKNRYNHTVNNPDATFSNDLDNIIPGLTESFANYYGMVQKNYQEKTYDFLGYVKANDGKYYKYNYEINNVYYCPDNIVIDNFSVLKYPKEKYLVMDYFILDLVNKKIISYLNDSFIETIGNIKNISIKNDYEQKLLIITSDIGEDIIIVLDKYNRIIDLKNNNVKVIPDDFLKQVCAIKNITMDNVCCIGKNFLLKNCTLESISLMNVKNVGNDFLANECYIEKIFFPELRIIGDGFCYYGSKISNISLPNVEVIGEYFLGCNNRLKEITLPSVIHVGTSFLYYNEVLENINLPVALKIGDSFCYYGAKVSNISLPKVNSIGNYFLYNNHEIKEINFPEAVSIGQEFMTKNYSTIKNVFLPNVKSIGKNFLNHSFNSISVFYAPKLDNDIFRQLYKNKKILTK